MTQNEPKLTILRAKSKKNTPTPFGASILMSTALDLGASSTLLAARGVVLNKKWGTPEKRLRQRF